jgi:uncharacterized protein
MTHALIYVPSARVVADNVRRATSLWSQGIGLMGRSPLREGQGLWLPGVTSVHTFGVRFNIDVLFLDGAFRMTAAYSDIKPWKAVWSPPSTRHCIELKSGTLLYDEIDSAGSQWRLQSSKETS